MNKFALFLCIILVFNYSQSIEDEQLNKLYDYLVEILKGFSREGNNECANIFINNRSKMISIIKKILKDLQDGAEMLTIATRYFQDLLMIDSAILSKCQLLGWDSVLKKFKNQEQIKKMGEIIRDNASEVRALYLQMKEAQGLLNKIFYVGKFLALILNFNVY